MYIIVAGAGVVGFHIAWMLAEEGHEVTVMERSEEALASVRRQLDVKTVLGNVTTPKLLQEAEVHRADLIVAVTNNDETNMVVCFMAKELGAIMTAARVRNPDYSGYFITPAGSPTAPRKVVRPKSLGIDLFITPEVEASDELTDILTRLYPTRSEKFADGRVQLREFRVELDTVIGQQLGSITLPKPCVVVAITRAEELIKVGKNTVLKQGDYIYLVAHRDDMDELGGLFAQPQSPAKNVVVLGGGLVGFLVAKALETRGGSVRVIERNESRSQEVAARLGGRTVVLHGDGTDREFLIEQGVPSADAFVATTENDEINILCGVLAKNIGVSRSLILVNKPWYISLAEAIGVDVAISPALATARKIARVVLRGGAISTAFICGRQLQAVEFVVSPAAHIAQKKISEVGFPEEVVVGAIVRGDEVIIPPGDSIVQPGDHVIAISPLSTIPSVEKLFK